MRTPTVGMSCRFVDAHGHERAAVILSVNPPTFAAQQEWHGEGEERALRVLGEEQVTDGTVDLLFAPDDQPVDRKTAFRKSSALHRSQQTPNADGELRNYWIEAP